MELKKTVMVEDFFKMMVVVEEHFFKVVVDFFRIKILGLAFKMIKVVEMVDFLKILTFERI